MLHRFLAPLLCHEHWPDISPNIAEKVWVHSRRLGNKRCKQSKWEEGHWEVREWVLMTCCICGKQRRTHERTAPLAPRFIGDPWEQFMRSLVKEGEHGPPHPGSV